MRLFIAVNFNNDVKDKIVSIQEALKESTEGGRFTQKDKLHLTLVFLGEHQPEEVQVIERIIDSVSVKPFTLTISGTGLFKRSGILWAGVKENDYLTDLYNQLHLMLIQNGFEIESRPFRPHITLARDFIPGGDLPDSTPEILFEVNAVSLMKSEFKNRNLIYTEIYKKWLIH